MIVQRAKVLQLIELHDKTEEVIRGKRDKSDVMTIEFYRNYLSKGESKITHAYGLIKLIEIGQHDNCSDLVEKLYQVINDFETNSGRMKALVKKYDHQELLDEHFRLSKRLRIVDKLLEESGVE